MEEEVPSIVTQLVDMGFDLEKSKLAYKKANNPTEVEKVIEYIQDHDEALDLELATKMSEEPQQSQEQPQQQQEQQQQSEESKTEEQKMQEEANLKPISDMVDQGLVSQLVEMGNSKNVAEKALFMTQNQKTIDAALDYIQEHREDEDFEEQLFISGQMANKPKLTPEEARIKAKEMQAALRKKREEQEEASEFEREKRRREMGKQMGATQELLKEAQKKREVEQQLRERQQFELDKKKMQDQLDRDYIERFGMEKFKKWKTSQTNQEKEKSPIEKTETCIKAIITAHPQKVFPDKAMTCLKTLKIYIEAIIKNPSEEKFRKVNSQNAGFKKRVGDCFSGQSTLESVGFVLQQDGFLVMQNPNVQFLQQTVALLEKHMQSI